MKVLYFVFIFYNYILASSYTNFESLDTSDLYQLRQDADKNDKRRINKVINDRKMNLSPLERKELNEKKQKNDVNSRKLKIEEKK